MAAGIVVAFIVGALVTGAAGPLSPLPLPAAAAASASEDEGDDPASIPPIPSAGCGTSTIETGTIMDDRRMAVGDVERTWSMYVPEAHDGVTPIPLWVQLHGSPEDGWLQVTILQAAAEEHGFAVVGPDADLSLGGWTYRVAEPVLDTSMANPDIAYLDALLDQLEQELCIDLARVYVSGFSVGGEGASVYGCVLEDRVAAVASVSSMLDLGDACELERPVPFMAIHGTADATASFDGGYDYRFDAFPSVQAMAEASIPDRVANVAARNGCDATFTTEAIDDGRERRSWDCPDAAAVELIVHDRWHVWEPYPNEAPGTTDLVWEFFERHPMPE
jgi:polyhydroxybutyrate depolymerase